ncbi:putative endonuclease or glycosyl hydrolase [Forsythia ovata]|uniref:Endonuclease or glycosyl hydrolase n=1 Tax=Forsythia ovata TaxID=205694 RepID=A0ABD1WS31_9LAMI
MNPISRKPFLIFSFFTPKAPTTHFKISHNFSFSTQTSHNSVSSYPSRRHEEESRSVRVSVWWDFENCSLPCNVNVFRVAHCIANAIRANGIKGPIQITAFGDVMQLSRANQEALSATGINLSHIPSGGKNSADRSLLIDLMYWVSQNPPPAHLFLISGDRDFAGILHRLRMNNYNILLASKDSAPSVLCSAASIMWQWNTLIMGENLTGKHFNQPPDGPYGSWYGHYKAPLDDPFAVVEQSLCSHSEELSELGSDSKLRPIPKIVIKQMKRILYSYPKGILITELRSELAKSNLVMDKDLYGYKKFSRFLLAMPHILKLQSSNDGQFLVRGVKPKVSDESLPSVYEGPVSNTGEPEIGYVPKPNGTTEKSEKQGIGVQELQKSGEESSPTKMEEVQVKNQKVDVQESAKKVQLPSPHVEIMDLSKDSKSQVHDAADAELGFFRRIWRNWFRSEDNDSKKTNCSKQEEISNGKKRMEEENVISPSSHEAIIGRRIGRRSDDFVGKSIQFSSIFNQIMSWCKFRGSADFDYVSEESDKEVNQIKNDSKMNDMFSNEAFWNELEAFMNTSQGSALVLQSRTRVHLAENLQKQGPSVLRSIHEGDLLHLVDLLISDKKWVEESDSQTCPFRVISYMGKDQANDHPPYSSGLSSMFRVGLRPSTLQELGERECQNPPHTGVPQTVSQIDCSSKSRDEILVDCQKLVDHILKEYPEGFNMGSFRKLFLEKYGYALDLQKLGYQKLVSLLQVMPRVTIESNYIFPFEVPKSRQGSNDYPVANSDRESSDGLRKDDDSESPWEELGPVDNAHLEKIKIDPRFTRKAKNERNEPTFIDYEPLGEDDLSDSEEESSSTKSEIEAKSRRNKEDSSLLNILDSWYGSQDDKSRKDALENTSNMSDCSKNGIQQSAPTEFGIKTEGLFLNQARKQKPSKSYSFVSEQPGDDKDRLVDGILGSLKK